MADDTVTLTTSQTVGSDAVLTAAVYFRLIDSGLVRLDSSKNILQLIGRDGLSLSQPVVIIKYLTSQLNPDIASAVFTSDLQQRAAIDRWLAFATQRDFNPSDATSLHIVNSHLGSRTFFVGNNITLADMVMFAALHRWMELSSAKERAANPAITRWFNHIQHLPGIFDTPDIPFNHIPISLEGSAAVMKQPVLEKASKLSGSLTTEQPVNEYKKQEKKEKEKKLDNKPPKEAERPVNDPTRLEIIVGKILKVWDHPEADKLYCEEIDIGGGQTRRIASGLRDYISVENLEGEHVLVLANMKEKKLRGFPSHGMVLCGKKDLGDGKELVELVLPPAQTPTGERVSLEGLNGEILCGEPDTVMNNKTGKDPFVAVQPEFRVDENGVAFWTDKQWYLYMQYNQERKYKLK